MAFFIIQLCYNISDLYLQVNTNLQLQQHPHQGRIPTAAEVVTGKPAAPDQGQDRAPSPSPAGQTGTISDHFGSSKAAAAAEQAQFPGWVLQQLPGESCHPFPDQLLRATSSRWNVHVPAHELPIRPVRAGPGQVSNATSNSEREPKVFIISEPLFLFYVSVFKSATVHFILPSSPSAGHPPENFNTD